MEIIKIAKQKFEKFIKSIQELARCVQRNPIQSILCLLLGGVGISLLGIFFYYLFSELFGIAFIIWILAGCPTPNFQNTPTPVLDYNSLDCFMLEVLSEKHDLLEIRKPIDMAEIKMYPPVVQKGSGSIQVYQCRATQAENASLDEDSMNERRLITQERITEKLQAGTSTINLPAYYSDLPALYIDEVTVRGNKFIFDVIWSANESAKNYIISRKNKQGTTMGDTAQDEDF